LWLQRRRVWAAVAAGATIFLCGSANKMPEVGRMPHAAPLHTLDRCIATYVACVGSLHRYIRCTHRCGEQKARRCSACRCMLHGACSRVACGMVVCCTLRVACCPVYNCRRCGSGSSRSSRATMAAAVQHSVAFAPLCPPSCWVRPSCVSVTIPTRCGYNQ
jgi:hypothetical protein